MSGVRCGCSPPGNVISPTGRCERCGTEGPQYQATLREREAARAPAPPFDIPGEFQTVAPPVDIPGELSAVHDEYRHWFGPKYDLDALDVVLAVAASEKLTGDPPWLLVVGGSGAAKTETLMPLTGVTNTVVVSTITSDAGLLSATSERERAKDATGGLLRVIGSRGTLVLKDFTSVLSMHRETRALILAALREIYDGHWTRNAGTDGGKTFTWTGRLVLIGACTTAWDAAHAVVSAMGDRFVLVRLDSGDSRADFGRQAMRNVGQEPVMRANLAKVVRELIDSINPDTEATLADAEVETLLSLADLVTRARTAVQRDFQGNPEFAHDLEMPTRFAKQLVQVVRGAQVIGLSPQAALRVAMRCARDTMPPLRRVIVGDVARHPRSSTREVVKRLQMPRQTVDRALQEMQLLRLLVVEDEPAPTERDPERARWVYSLAPDIDAAVVRKVTAVHGIAENSPGMSQGGAGSAPDGPQQEAEPEDAPAGWTRARRAPL
jgi:hypothetical protein